MINKIIEGDCLKSLREMPDKSVNCCITSPPYYGLRDYGTANWVGGDKGCDHVQSENKHGGQRADRNQEGYKKQYNSLCGKCGANRIDSQIGLEETPEQFVEQLVQVFREVKRILKDDGVMFLNLGDSYFSSSQRATVYGTSDKAPVNYQANGCLCGSLCGVCREVLSRKSHIYNLLSPMLIASLSYPTPLHKESQPFRVPTSDLTDQEARTLISILDFVRLKSPSDEQTLSFRESMPNLFFQQLLDECLRRDSSSSCLLCARTLVYCELNHVDSSVCNSCTVKPLGALGRCKLGNSFLDLAYSKDSDIKPNSSLKPKDLIGIPWMVAFALRADGWYLRQDIIWHKPNPMPESVTDRCTKAHEYIFLLSKSKQYYFDNDAIRGPIKLTEGDTVRFRERKTSSPFGNRDEDTQQREVKYDEIKGANKRSVWTVNTKPYSGAHFATFPEELITDCIKAGCPENGIVLDPFGGAGTTAVVARKLNRNYLLCELNPDYIKIAENRLKQELGLFI